MVSFSSVGSMSSASSSSTRAAADVGSSTSASSSAAPALGHTVAAAGQLRVPGGYRDAFLRVVSMDEMVRLNEICAKIKQQQAKHEELHVTANEQEEICKTINRLVAGGRVTMWAINSQWLRSEVDAQTLAKTKMDSISEQ